MSPRVPSGTEVALRPAAPGDEAFLLEVYASSRAEELALAGWTPAQRSAFVEMQFRAQHADYTRRFPGSRHSVVLDGTTPVGRIWVHRDGREIRLLDVTILPAHQGRGIGTALLRRLQAEAREAGVPLRHTVLLSNAGARRLYERLGFATLDRSGAHALMEWRPPS